MDKQNLVKLEYPVQAWPEYLCKRVSVDTEYAPDDTLLTVAAANTTRSAALDFTYGLGQFPGVVENATWLIGHSAMGDVDQLVKLGLCKETWVAGKNLIDTLLVARMIDENQPKGGYELETTLLRCVTVKPWKSETVAISKTDATLWPANLRQERCRLDAWASAIIADKYARKIPAALRSFTTEVASSIHRIELAGACVDLKVFEAMGASLFQSVEHKKHLLEVATRKLGMESFTPTKDIDIRTLIYGKLKKPITKTTKKTRKAAVDQKTIQKFSNIEVVKNLLAYNKDQKLLSTWYGTVGSKRQSLKDMIAPYSRIGDAPSELGWLPFHINPLGARTGRRSSERPNSQNWPKSVRRIIVSRWANGKIGAFDYKSLEPFILSWLANDEKLFDYFSKRGGYIAIAKDLLHKEVQKGTTDYVIVKSVFLATTYNQLPYTLAMSLDERLGVRLANDWEDHVVECGKLIKGLLDMFPGVRRFMQERRSEVARTGQVVSASGRIRHLPYPKQQDFETEREWKRAKKRVENQAINYPVQSFAADVTGSALIDVEAALCARHGVSLLDLHSKLLHKDYPRIPLIINEVHDEVTVDLPNSTDVKLIAETMMRVPTLRKLVPSFDLPLSVDVKVEDAWGA